MGLELLIFYTILAIGVSFLCSILEAVVLSVPNTQVAVWQKESDKRGVVWSKLKADDAVKPLTAILTLNTIAHTMGAAGVGSQVQDVYGNEYLTIASILLTLAVLFLSEIIPKSLGTAYWRQLSLITGRSLVVITTLGLSTVASSAITRVGSSMDMHSKNSVALFICSSLVKDVRLLY